MSDLQLIITLSAITTTVGTIWAVGMYYFHSLSIRRAY